MTPLNVLIIVCLGYVILLFLVAFAAERAAMQGRGAWLHQPMVYTLSLSVYCTAWTFYGAVGNAARSGLEFLTIYLGPTIVMVGWWWILRKLVRIGRSQRITSVADLISSRFGKSNLLAVCVTVLAVIGTTPYIALQLQSVTLSFAAFAQAGGGVEVPVADTNATAIWVAAGLALFTILFGTRNLDVNERHYGVVMAIAVEAVVKLCALLAVGVFVVWGVSGGVAETLQRIDASAIGTAKIHGGRWAALTFLSGAAFLCLPRMFQVLVVENQDESHLQTASWAFPVYVMLISLFVIPIAVVGLQTLPAGSNPDLFVLTVPLSQGQDGLAILSFLGGFSSATSMVIVAAIALSTMVSNHIVMPIWVRATGGGASMSGDVRHVVLLARRVAIAGVVFLGYLYFRLSGGGAALTSIGLVSFAGVVQVLPAMLGGIFWRGATRMGALSGLLIGFLIWLYTLFLPSFASGIFLPEQVVEFGLFGLDWLRPQALLGIEGLDPLVHAVLLSMSLNTLVFVLVSLVTLPSPLEQLQGAQFVNVYEHSTRQQSWTGGVAQSEDLMVMAQRILGAAEAQALFQAAAKRQGVSGYLPEPSVEFLAELEREMAGSVGAATAHAMVGQITGGTPVSVHALLAVADETAQMKVYSFELETKSQELARAALQLRDANTKLTQLSVQKDAFLSQVSHELRTPMSSIRAFSEILRDVEELSPEKQNKYASIIQDETIRLTGLLDDLLDLSVLENGQVILNIETGALSDLLDHAVALAQVGSDADIMQVHRASAEERIWLRTDLDRLSQVFLNLIENARKYCDATVPELRIEVWHDGAGLTIDFIDNGSGISTEDQNLIFEKFARIGHQKTGGAGGAGLGLTISREIIQRLGGDIEYLPGQSGAAFRLRLPDGALSRSA